MTYTLAIFDMDGTILDTLDDLCNSVNATMQHFGFPVHTLDEVRRFVGNGIPKLIERAVPEGTSPEKEKEALDFFMPYYKAHCAEQTKPYEGICELLSALRAAGVKTAVVSNKADVAVKELCEVYFDGIFDYALGATEQMEKKPAPDSVLAVMRILGFSKEESVYIGDSDVDLQTAKNAELPCIAVEWGFRDSAFLKAHGADCLVQKPEQILDLILPATTQNGTV